jgi:hypothetical protein
MKSALLFAAANPLLVLLVLAVTFVFYLVQAVFKSTMEPKNLRPPANPARPPRAQQPRPVPSQAINSLEDYLKEARRKRAMEAGVIPPPLRETNPVPARVESFPASESFKPVLIPAPAVEQRLPKPKPVPIPRAQKTTQKQPRSKSPAARPDTGTAPSIPTPTIPQALPPAAALSLPGTLLQTPNFSSSASRRSPLAEIITASLADPKSIANALVLREILGPPASIRNRTRRGQVG